MLYTIRHITRFKYSAPIHENVVEVRMQPRSDDYQYCHRFQLQVRPQPRIASYQDYLGNGVHHFNIPGLHTELTISAEAEVRVTPPPPLPDALSPDDWQAVDESAAAAENWEMVTPSPFTQPTPALLGLAAELHIERCADPLTLIRDLMHTLNQPFAYAPEATQVDSPIDEAIEQRRG
ncbi:MAG: transglutaminase family protein, partial [Chloroflexota bacterium]|nr:transglutaminase family protein [Chloroflexota bacterium]